MSSNIVFAHKLCTNNDVTIEFDVHFFCFKKAHIKIVLIKGLERDGFYTLHDSPKAYSFTPSYFVSNSNPLDSSLFYGVVTSNVLKKRIIYLSNVIIQKVIAYSDISACLNNNNDRCTMCSLAKAHKLSFHSNHILGKHAFDLIYMNIWNSPILSNIGSKYFIFIVDDHSRFMYSYFLHTKNQVQTIFMNFMNMVERYFFLSNLNRYKLMGEENSYLSLSCNL